MSIVKYQVHDETSQVSYTTSSIYEVGLLTRWGRLLCFVLSDSVVYPLFPVNYRGIFRMNFIFLSKRKKKQNI